MTSKTPNYDTLLFSEIYDTPASFVDDWLNSGFPDVMRQESLLTLYLLLLGRYGNNPIANRDFTQWHIKLCSIIFQYGPTWEKRLDIQEKLRGLKEDELMKAGKSIHNRAYNPDTKPGTAALEELPFINEQSTSSGVRSKLDAYALLWELLDNDVSEEFLRKFKPLFKIFVSPEYPTLYYDED